VFPDLDRLARGVGCGPDRGHRAQAAYHVGGLRIRGDRDGAGEEPTLIGLPALLVAVLIGVTVCEPCPMLALHGWSVS
jgi:hypothetical protein